MSKKSKRPKKPPEPKPQARPAPSLYLVAPTPTDPAAFGAMLESALEGGAVACVLVAPAQGDAGRVRKTLEQWTMIARRHDAALIAVADSTAIVAAGADGAHVRGPGPDLAEAVAALKPDHIVGASGLKTRHDAMEAGELDIDYLMFGEPAPDGWIPPHAETLERVEWWAEIFNVPCVAFATAFDEIGPLVAAGADFIALGDLVWKDPRGPAEAVRSALVHLRATVSA